MPAEKTSTLFIALTNPEPGKEAEYNDWYDNIHLPEIVATEGFVSARRFKLSGAQMESFAIDKQPYKYMAISELESGAVAAGKGQQIMDNLIAAIPGMKVLPVIDMANGWGYLVESIGDTVHAK